MDGELIVDDGTFDQRATERGIVVVVRSASTDQGRTLRRREREWGKLDGILQHERTRGVSLVGSVLHSVPEICEGARGLRPA